MKKNCGSSWLFTKIIHEGIWLNVLRPGFPESTELVLAASVGHSVSCYDIFVYKGKAIPVETY
jgi:hypothetical protein